MAVALFLPSFSTTPAGQLHCQAVIELSFSAPAHEDSSSDEFVTFTTKEAKTEIFTHRWGYGYFPRAHRLSLLLTKRVSLFAAWQLNCRAVRRRLTWWRIKVEIAEGKNPLQRCWAGFEPFSCYGVCPSDMSTHTLISPWEESLWINKVIGLQGGVLNGANGSEENCTFLYNYLWEPPIITPG